MQLSEQTKASLAEDAKAQGNDPTLIEQIVQAFVTLAPFVLQIVSAFKTKPTGSNAADDKD